MQAPPISGGWITGRFRGHYEGLLRGLERTPSGEERRRVRLLRGTLTDARFSPFGPQDPGPALRQPALAELWVAAGTGDDGHPRWQRLAVRDVWLCAFEKVADELHEGASLGEIVGVLWGRVGPGDIPADAPIEVVPERIPVTLD